MSPEVKQIFKEHDIILFTETWSNKQTELEVQGFEHYALHRGERKSTARRDSGGLVIYIANYLKNYVKFLKTDKDDILWVCMKGEVFASNDDLYLCLCYNTPIGSSREAMDDGISIFDRILQYIVHVESSSRNKCQFLICGDFNARVANLSDYVENDSASHVSVLPDDYVEDVPMARWSEDTGTNQYGPFLLDFCKQSGLRIVNGRFGQESGKYTYLTDRGKSVIDYVISSQTLFNRISNFMISDPNILSDHCLLSFSLKCEINTFTQEEADNSNLIKLSRKYVWRPEHCEQYIGALNSHETISSLNELTNNLSNSSSQRDIDENVSRFNTLLDSVCKPLFNKKLKTEKENSPDFSCKTENKWFNDECKIKRLEFYKCLNLYRKNKNDINCKAYTQARSAYKIAVRNAKYEYAKQQTEKLNKAKRKNAKEYWKMLKNMGSSKRAVGLSANKFYDYFKAVNNPEDRFFQPDDDVLHFNERVVHGEFQVMFQELDVEITVYEINKAVKNLKQSKSGGPDQLLNEFLKYGFDALRPYLLKLYNIILSTGFFPTSWGEGFIIPIFKKGNVENVENYRGITLLSVVGKLFTSIINNRLNEWAENYHVYIEAQAGFRNGMGTIDNIFVLHGLITHCLNNSGKLFAAFVDFQKAFDFVVRDTLWCKLIKLGIRGKVFTVIQSIYSNIKSRVKFDNCLSNDFSCYLGVRQGECLSPILFSMYLNDIENEFILKGAVGIDIGMLKLFLLLYADDIIIFANDKDNLQRSLNILEQYCKTWKLKVNTNKTKVMVFRKGGRLPENLHFFYDGSELEKVNKFVYLGVTFSTGGSFHETQNDLSGKALKAIFQMNKYLYKFTDISLKHRIELFDKLISPILTYSAEVWGFIQAPAIERVHLKFLKTILTVKTSTPNDFIYAELGRMTMRTNRLLIIIKYWFKVIASEDTKFIKCVYKMMLNDAEDHPTKINWAILVRNLLSELGFYEVWVQQGVGNYNLFLSLLKQRLTDTFVQNHNARVQTLSRARFFNLFSSFQWQDYLNIIKVPKYRNALIRFRLSSHRLAVETGRWNKPRPTPFDERKCERCNVLEDEFHFLFECLLYTDLRKCYISEYFWKRPNVPKLEELLTSTNENTLKLLGIYVFKAFQLRNQLLFKNG